MQVYYSLNICSLTLMLITLTFMNNQYGNSKSDIGLNYQFPIAVPEDFNVGFSGKAFLMDTSYQMEPNFRVALSVEAAYDRHGIGRYSCSLQVFLGDVKVWNSGHYSSFFVSEKCVIELTGDGDLRLKGGIRSDVIGWRTATSGQGVERLEITKTGNLVLLDGLDNIKWQSFNFPTNVMLWGQRLNVATRLTSFPSNSTSHYSLQIETNKISLYLNSPKTTNSNYSYWEFNPSNRRNLTYIQLSSRGLEFYNDEGKKIGQIPSLGGPHYPLRFLSLSNTTGNLGLYYYSPSTQRFEAGFLALNATCDLPLACQPYGICTFSNTCSCIHVGPGCADGAGAQGLCGAGTGMGEMIELEDVRSVLRSGAEMGNVSREECAEMCLEDCGCVSAGFSSEGGCSFYGLAGGLKQVERGSGVRYFVKVRKGDGHGAHRGSNVKRWVLVLVGVVDGFVILVVLGGIGYYFVRKRRRGLLLQEGGSS